MENFPTAGRYTRFNTDGRAIASKNVARAARWAFARCTWLQIPLNAPGSTQPSGARNVDGLSLCSLLRFSQAFGDAAKSTGKCRQYVECKVRILLHQTFEVVPVYLE